MESDTIVWITGATDGIGAALARNCPYPDARIINLSRTRHPELETVLFDLTDPGSWDTVREHLKDELSRFKGKRAIFIQNAYFSDAIGLIGKVSSALYEKSVIGNVAAPLVVGEAFLTACPDHIEGGLVMMSSGAAVSPLPGISSYCASKAMIEHWAEVVAREREDRGKGPWVVAVRPGGTDTAPVRAIAKVDPELYPRAARIAANLPNRLDPDSAAKHIWDVLPPKPGIAVISFAPPPQDRRFAYGGERIETRQVPGWELVYA